jgi:hypothetical protein
MDSSKLWISRHGFVLKLRNLHDLRGGSEARCWGRPLSGWVGITMIVKLVLLTAIYCAIMLLPWLAARSAVAKTERA